MRRRILVIGLLAVVVAGVTAGVIAPEVVRHSSAKRALVQAPVSLVGDSLNVGVEPYLEEELAGWQIATDDVVGRPTETGLEHLRALGSALGHYVVVSLGTNDPLDSVAAFRTDVDAVMALAGGTRCVVWSTIHRDGDAYEPFNEVLRTAAARNRNLRLVEWTTMIGDHPEWLVSDGVHATADGYSARAQAIVAAMRTCPSTT
jgi:lysophospholipase L1-like esterase